METLKAILITVAVCQIEVVAVAVYLWISRGKVQKALDSAMGEVTNAVKKAAAKLP